MRKRGMRQHTTPPPTTAAHRLDRETDRGKEASTDYPSQPPSGHTQQHSAYHSTPSAHRSTTAHHSTPHHSVHPAAPHRCTPPRGSAHARLEEARTRARVFYTARAHAYKIRAHARARVQNTGARGRARAVWVRDTQA